MSTTQSKTTIPYSRRELLKAGAFGLLAVSAAPMLFSGHAAHAAANSGRKRLTVYYSRTDNTRVMARYIHEMVGGDILEVKPVTPYSGDYTTATLDSRRELLTGVRTPIQPINAVIASYDVIFLGSPRWWGTLSVPILNFVLGNDLSGKTIVPFTTHGGGPQEKTFDDLQLLCPKAKVLEGLPINGSSVRSSQNEISGWLRKVGMNR